MAKQEVEFEKTLDTNDVIDYFEQVIAGLRGGQVLVQEAGDSVALEVKSPLKMEIEADFDSEKQKCSFELKLEWRLAEPQARQRGEGREG